jgi:outer membrane lipoprotein LolB
VTRALRRLALPLLLALLGACSSLPRAPSDGEVLSGRLSVQVETEPGTTPRAVSAAFELSGNPRSGRLDLTNPLGSVMAQASWAPGAVVLKTPQATSDYPDLDALTRAVLGESLPVAALFDWLRGRPWPGAPSRPDPEAAGFEQLGWVVDLARFAEGWVVARRASSPVVTVRARLDR